MAGASGSAPIPSVAPPAVHHAALKTRDIVTAMNFYGLLGFEATHKFRAGPARAAWLSNVDSGNTTRLELIEVPAYSLNEPPGKRRRAIDLLSQQQLLGWNHFALDVTASLEKWNQDLPVEEARLESLDDWLRALNATSLQEFGKTLNVGLPPRQQRMGPFDVFEIAFLYDPDGSLVELLYRLPNPPETAAAQEASNATLMESGWEPWNGEVFLQ